MKNKLLLIAISIVFIFSACEDNNSVEVIFAVYPIPNSNYTIIEKNYPEIKGSVRYGLGDANGNPISAIKYGGRNGGVFAYETRAIHYYGNGLFRVAFIEDSVLKYGLMDSTGKELTELKFNLIEGKFSSEGFVAAFIGSGVFTSDCKGKWGYFNRAGKEVVEVKYDWICCFSVYNHLYQETCCDSFFASGLTFMSLDNKWGFIDTTGKVVIPATFDYVSTFNEELAIVYLNGKYGFIDTTGKVVIPIIYDDARPFWNEDGTASVKLNGQWIRINKQGEIV